MCVCVWGGACGIMFSIRNEGLLWRFRFFDYLLWGLEPVFLTSTPTLRFWSSSPYISRRSSVQVQDVPQYLCFVMVLALVRVPCGTKHRCSVVAVFRVLHVLERDCLPSIWPPCAFSILVPRPIVSRCWIISLVLTPAEPWPRSSYCLEFPFPPHYRFLQDGSYSFP